jgi:hypothetical protein
MRVEQKCQLVLTFFGLTPEYKIQLHKSIFSLVTFGRGGWSWNDVYNLPIHLRMFYIKEFNLVSEREHSSTIKSPPTSKISPPPYVKQ